MSIREALLPEFDHEMANTRKLLERVPAAAFDWSPHEKSYTLRDLTTHLSHLPDWATGTLANDELDMALTPRNEPVESVGQALEIFDRKVGEARTAIAAADDASMMREWSLLMGGQTIFSMPKIAVLRSFVMNHMIHHRGQMSVYLRLKDVALPPLYGPTADEAN